MMASALPSIFFEIISQKFPQKFHGFPSVADTVFFLGCKLAECFSKGRIEKYRNIAESGRTQTLLRYDTMNIAHNFLDDGLLAGQDHTGDKTGLPLSSGLVSQQYQNLIDIGIIRRIRSGESCRINTGRIIQTGNFQAGIFGQCEAVPIPAVSDSFSSRVFQEGALFLVKNKFQWNISKREDLHIQIAQQAPYLSDFSIICCC